VNAFVLGRGFLVSDPDYTPFGFSWLRGITSARLGLVALVCFVFSVRQSTYGIVSLIFLQQLPLTICYTIVYVGASLPMMVMVSCADRRTRRSSSKYRIIVLSLAVVAGAATYAAGIALVFGGSMWGASASLPLSLLPAISYFLRALLMGGLLTGVLYFVTREKDATDALQTTRVTRIDLEKQMAEAHLRVLQAQVGTVKILAVRDGDHLSVSVADDGVGFQGFAGGGVGLANTRARLAALYGADGLLTFSANPVRGVTVSVTLPYGVVSDERSAS